MQTLKVNREILGPKVFESEGNLKALTSISSPEIKDLLFEHFAYAKQ